ncbi:unnamed protein product [Penicillium olsonii]|nr:unnamed protein product [Penicillium olsonii]
MSLDPLAERSKIACISCRQRKRKCDGEMPCTYCVKNAHECEYEKIRKKRKQQYRHRLQSREEIPPGDEPRDGSSQLQLLEANSPAVFVRRLGLKINPAMAPRFSCYAWNLGLKQINCLPQASCITDILSLAQMDEIVTDYFNHIAPAYNFLDRDYVEKAIVKRWRLGLAGDSTDSMLCGLAALGCLFGGRPSALETQLVQSARSALEQSSSLPSPEIDHVIGWIMRVIYLRATGSPEATWMACCTLMHMIETTKLHLEPSEDWILAQPGSPCSPDLRRRVYWIAQLFNTWVSLDCGKSQVELRGSSSKLPGGSWTKDQQELCYLFCCLGKRFEIDQSEIDAELRELCALNPVHPMLQLLQCNIGLCFFRRSRALGQVMSDDSLALILGLAKNSLLVVKLLIETNSPWWHVINIPFQIVCVILVSDTDQALELLPSALTLLKKLADNYQTGMCSESYEIAQFLVSQERQKRLKKIKYLTDTLVDEIDETTINTKSGWVDSLGPTERVGNVPSTGALPDVDFDTSLADYLLLENLFHGISA